VDTIFYSLVMIFAPLLIILKKLKEANNLSNFIK
jgi:hypothetical protein